MILDKYWPFNSNHLLLALFGRCNFLNYRRNTECFHCDCKRPPDEFTENKIQEKQRGSRRKLEKIANQSEFSNAWNFDFDDNESDGAEVAAFEYADSSMMRESNPSDNQDQGNFGRPGYNLRKTTRVQRVHDEEFSDADSSRPGKGFDDFDDEEDDIESYELDTSNGNAAHKVALNDLSDFKDYDTNLDAHRRAKKPSYNKQSTSMHQRTAFSGSDDDELDFDSGKDLSVHPKWRSSHVADSGPRSRGRNRAGPSKRLSFGSDDEAGLYSDLDDDSDGDFRSRQQGKTNKLGPRRDFRRRGSSDTEDDLFSGSGSEKDDRRSLRGRSRSGNKSEFSRRGNNFKGNGSRSSSRDTKPKFNGMKGGGSRRNSFDEDDDDFDGFSQGNRGNRRFRGNQRDGPRMSNRGGDMNNFKGPRREGFQGSRHKYHGREMDRDFGEFRNSRRVIER